MIRAFLTKVGEMYLGHSFNTASGKGKDLWQTIVQKTFENRCAYCDMVTDKPTIEHLIMFNRDCCGLHHPGNVVPSCRSCNRRAKHSDTKEWLTWQEHLQSACTTIDELNVRQKRISNHIRSHKYPNLTEDELNALKSVAYSLYDSTSHELEKSISLYRAIDKTLVKKRL